MKNLPQELLYTTATTRSLVVAAFTRKIKLEVRPIPSQQACALQVSPVHKGRMNR